MFVTINENNIAPDPCSRAQTLLFQHYGATARGYCYAALQMRWERHHDGPHPLKTRNAVRREQLLLLLERTVTLQLPVVRQMRTLAGVAIAPYATNADQATERASTDSASLV